MFNFKEAFTYIFKEKDWHLKFLLPFLLQLIFVVPSVLLTYAEPNASLNLNTSRVNYRAFNAADAISMLYFVFILIAVVPYTVINAWYMYENTQAGIFNRATVAIWKNKLEDTLKKAAKYLLTSFAYGFLGLLILLVVGGVVCAVVFGILILARSMMTTGGNTNDIFAFLTTGVGAIFLCLFFIVFVIFYILFYVWMTVGSLRLVATNTLSEGLKLQENWRIAWRHKGKFFVLLLWIFLISMFLVILLSIVTVPVSIMAIRMPMVNVGFQLVIQVITALLTTYGSLFVLPRLLGQLFRKIVKEDESLKYIDIRE